MAKGHIRTVLGLCVIGIIVGAAGGAAVATLKNNGLLSFNFGSKWMTGKELAAKNADMNTPEAQAVIVSFDKDNGKIYCVPKMSGAELGEFRAKIPGLMIGGLMGNIFADGGMKDFNQDKPIESMLRMTFKKSYPCSK